MTNAAYEKYRAVKIENGKVYQDFVVDACWNLLGLAVVQYSSLLYQQTVGESKTGAEIKHDEQFARTANLWIEIEEKARPRPGPYVPSGIYRSDNTWLYIIGNYDHVFIFQKTLLQMLHRSGKWRLIENNTKTSRGFLLTESDANKWAAAVLRPNAAERIAKVIGDMSKLGRELHAASKRNLAQLDLFQQGEQP
jgi:hypothetical protein